MARLAMTAFSHTMLVYQAIAMKDCHETRPTMSQYPQPLQRASYTAPTREAVCQALPCIAAAAHMQARSHAACGTSNAIVPSRFDSQLCESAFASMRGPSSNQNTGAISCADALRLLNNLSATDKAKASGDLIDIPPSKQHCQKNDWGAQHYRWALTDYDITCSIHIGVQMAFKLMSHIGYLPFKSIKHCNRHSQDICRSPSPAPIRCVHTLQPLPTLVCTHS